MFDAKKVKNDIVKWIREWFEENGKGCNAVVGISGGKDSSIVAALCVEALGRGRVIGVTIPDGKLRHTDDSVSLINFLNIRHINVDICPIIDTLFEKLLHYHTISEQSEINMLPRIRMTTLYAVSQSNNGRVANTCNLSETYVGWNTRYGDDAGDFSPLANLTVSEVIAIGKELGLPDDLVEKVPADGLTNRSDEENFGFSYETLDKYIRTGICENKNIKKKIEDMHEKNLFKIEPMPEFEYSPNGDVSEIEEYI